VRLFQTKNRRRASKEEFRQWFVSVSGPLVIEDHYMLERQGLVADTTLGILALLTIHLISKALLLDIPLSISVSINW
jgi:hypothetical protein